jgi:hypothetical protein
MKRGLYLAPFDELADPRLLAELVRVGESRGWDSLFLWDLTLGVGLGNPGDLMPYGPWPRRCDGSGKRQIRLRGRVAPAARADAAAVPDGL